MSATFISGLVIKQNNEVYLTDDLVVGVIKPVPTPGGIYSLDGDYWAVPITNYGVATGFNFVPTFATDTDAPTPQSFHVFRLTSRFGNDSWYVRGTTSLSGDSPAEAGYIEVSQDAECCAESPRTLPTDVPDIVPCQVACEWNADENYFVVLGLPTDTGTYTGTGYMNGEALPTITAATPAALETQLNNNWTNLGSPNVAITWTVTNLVAMGVITDGTGEDSFCASITVA